MEEARDHWGKQIFGDGRAAGSGERALAWRLLLVYGYNHCDDPDDQIAHQNQQMMNIRCAIAARSGRKLLKPPNRNRLGA